MKKNEASDDPRDAVSLRASQLAAVDTVCDRFELAWQFGDRPSIKALIGEVDPKLRRDCFRHLLELDLEYRRQKGEAVLRDDYRAEFGEFQDAIDDVFAEYETVDIDTEDSPTTTLTSVSADKTHEAAARIGRFQIVETIAEGGFGTVYLGYDEDLKRRVAIKVARLGRPAGYADLQLLEARIAASLDHPGIVPVYEICRLPSGRLFIVSKLIEGTDLRSRLKEFSYSLQEAASLVIDVADALHSAHQKGIIHRDIKPANILIDRDLRPFLTDFGLALREEETGSGARFVGTVRYMSPEQAREEGHLVDVRSDVFSLCIVLYELVTGRVPFEGDTRSELLASICDALPAPPSFLNDQVDTELERIILKGLARRAGDRFQSAKDFANELRAWQNQAASSPLAHQPSSMACVVPKGLRSFDESDHESFCRLLPGPRNRAGIPEAIDFWKTRIESRAGDSTFRVGVLYGPSGSGKSSFVQAGLVPLLDSMILSCRVVATPDSTEQTCLRELRRQIPALSRVTNLTQAVRELRSGDKLSRDIKVLIVIDQFEQWLSGQNDPATTSLVATLRQCDGVHVQALLLVRDDYWYSLSSCLKHVEVELSTHNCRMTEVFDDQHARSVLLAFGRAYERVSADATSDHDEAALFAADVINELAAGGSIVPVQLALFAETFRHRPWTRRELARWGGVKGVIAMFLDNIVTGDSAHPVLRQHQEGSVHLLKTLLPPSGSTLKDQPRPQSMLTAAIGGGDRAVAGEILSILDTEHRLIVAQHPDGDETGEVHYQLSHDYLVPIVRDWIARKQRDSFRGRAENLLEDRTAAWSTDPSRRFLPSAAEWLMILLFSRRASWSAASSRMMTIASRWYATFFTVGALIIVLAVTAANRYASHAEADSLVKRLLGADTTEVPAIVAEIQEAPSIALSMLRQRQFAASASSSKQDFRQQLHVAAALAGNDDSQLEYLLTRGIRGVAPHELLAVADVLDIHKVDVSNRMWKELRLAKNESSDYVLRIACMLAHLDPGNDRWGAHLDEIAAALLSSSSVDLKSWIDQLMPVADRLRRPLSRQFGSDPLDDQQSRTLAEVFARFASEDASALVAAIAHARPNQMKPLLVSLSRYSNRALPLIEAKRAAILESINADRVVQAKPPSQPVIALIENCDGHVGNTSAFVQSLPEALLEETIEEMSRAKFRPVSCRPYLSGDQLLVAIGWRRDGRDGRVSLQLTKPQLVHQIDASGQELVDLSSYETGAAARFAATWLVHAEKLKQHLSYIDLPFSEHQQLSNKFKLRGFYPTCFLVREGTTGEPLFSSLWNEIRQESDDKLDPVIKLASDFDSSFLGYLQNDCQLYCLDLTRSDRYHAYRLIERGFDLSIPNDRDIENLVISYLQLQKVDDALAILGKLVAKTPTHVPWHELRGRSLFAAKETTELRAELQQLEELKASDGILHTMRLRLAILHDDTEQAMKHLAKLEDMLTQDQDNNGLRVMVARATALSAGMLKQHETSETQRLQDRTVELLQHPGLKISTTTLLRDPDFDSLRSHLSFHRLLRDMGLGVRYAAIWSDTHDTESEMLFGLSLKEHIVQSVNLMRKGYFPRCVAVRSAPTRELIASSVWHHQFTPPELEIQLASNLANLAIASASLGNFLPLTEILAERAGRQPRAYVIERLPFSGIKADAISTALLPDQSPALQRNVWLTLGAYGAAARASVNDRLKSIENNEGADVRSARLWCQRRVGCEPPNAAPSDRLDRGPGWYLNAIGQTMIEINAPSRIVMGAPAWELRQANTEAQHLRLIKHPYSLSSTETTILEFREFLRDPDVEAYYAETGSFDYSKEYAPSDGCPQISVSYFDAMRFCQWLSTKEGIPEKDQCFPGVFTSADGEYIAPKDCLSRTGYRLPTEAEWEFGCRAGSKSSRHFGPADDTLFAHAWGMTNSNDQTHPVGLLIPNEFGLFDMLGNVREWCFDVYRRFDDPHDTATELVFSREVPRPARGGCFQSPNRELRSASRLPARPTTRNTILGFRVARTAPKHP